MANTTIEARWTRLGQETLINQGIVNTLVGYTIGDTFHNYAVLAPDVVPPSLGGNHIELTSNISCGEANGVQMYAVPPTQQEIDSAQSRLNFEFISEKCDNIFTKSGLSMRVSIDRLLARLVTNSVNYSFGMDGMGVGLWDYVSINVEKYDPLTSYYRKVDTINNAKLSWVPSTKEDAKNYSMISPTLMVNNQGTKTLRVTESRYQAPFGYYFNSTNVNGVNVDSTNGRFDLLTGRWGYFVNNNQFLGIADLETSDLDLYSSIVPAFYIGNTIYKYNAKGVSYNTSAGLVGYLNYFLADDGTTAVTGLYNQAYLAMKTMGKVSPTDSNVYELTVNFTVNSVDKRINSINNIVGNQVQTIFSFDTTNLTNYNNIVEILN